MTTYVDIYVSHSDLPTLEAFANNFVNHTPSVQGQAATADTPATYAADGVTIITPDIPAQPGKGDPKLFYTLIRATFDITPLVQTPFAVVDATTGASMCGVFL
jgi:hypothetical protein